MHEQHAFPFLREILLFLILAGILIPTLQRLRINQVLGFLAVGTLVGPFGLGLLAADVHWLSWLTFPSGPGVSMLAEIGVLFLMFMIGLELSAARLWSLRRWVFGAGSAQVLASAAIIGAAVVFLLGEAVPTAIILGLVLSLSSTAVVMQLMSEQQSTGSRMGQAAFAVLMLQDLAVVPILILIGALAKGNGDGAAMLAVVTMAKAGGAIALIYLVGGRVIHPLFKAFARQRQPDVFMALILLSTFGIAGLSAAAGLSMALGALIAGLLLGQGGEFAFIVIGYAISTKLLAPGLGARVMLAVGLSMFITPLLARLGRSIGERAERREQAHVMQVDDAELAAARGRIIIAGYGRVGQQLGKLLGAQRIDFIAFENNARMVSTLHAQGVPVYFGNAARCELLRRVHADEAPAIVLTMDHPASALQAVRGIRRDFPHVPLFVRSRDEKHARALRLAGATVVVPETLEASLQLSAFVLETMGLDERTVDDIVDRERDLFAEQLNDAGLREAGTHRA
ncbi:MAG TPA: potassium transporter [Massilia sp.]|nr:potassium transporter [Massilia sp.]